MEKSINLEFLNEERTGKEEFEVTNYSIKTMITKYKYLENDYIEVDWEKNRRQMSSEGAYLKANTPKKIDVVGDILTSEKFMDKIMVNPELMDKYKRVYHSVGNIIPIPEGANYGGGPGSDNYYFKLSLIKKWLKQKESGKLISKKEEKIVNDRIEKNLYLSSPAKGEIYPAFTNKLIHRFWINNETDFRDWHSYIETNFLDDFVDDNENLIPFDHKEPDLKKLIEMIIKRNYRILKSNCVSKSELQSFYQSVYKSL